MDDLDIEMLRALDEAMASKTVTRRRRRSVAAAEEPEDSAQLSVEESQSGNA